MTAKSIYAASKEGGDGRVAPQKPWLGLPQWIALVIASVLLALANALLRGDEISNLPAIKVASESSLLLAVTFVVGAVPAAFYWLAHKNWMPELTRFVWLVWIVVGFAFTYGNILTSMYAA
jgi:multisubunit Na+/H+ antiporter MnhB subunit